MFKYIQQNCNIAHTILKDIFLYYCLPLTQNTDKQTNKYINKILINNNNTELQINLLLNILNKNNLADANDCWAIA